jgi:hypothetical protein
LFRSDSEQAGQPTWLIQAAVRLRFCCIGRVSTVVSPKKIVSDSMMRPRSFIVLDVFITLPVLVVCLYSFFLGSDAPGKWFWWVFIACGLAVLLPSLAYLSGKRWGMVLSRCWSVFIFSCCFFWFTASFTNFTLAR